MAHGILSAKLYELDKKISRMHSRIQLGESADHDQILVEVTELRRECAEEALTLQDKLRLSKVREVARLSTAYANVKKTIRDAIEGIENDGAEDEDAAFTSERKILFAEYALDFAMQAVDCALLVSMKALDAEMVRREKEEDADT